MKPIFTLTEKKVDVIIAIIFVVILTLIAVVANSQVTTVCTNPTAVAYGLTGNGQISEINANSGVTLRTIKNTTYAGNAPSSANGIGYNSFNSRFYYFKRNVKASPQEFVSFNPATNTVSILASSTCTDDIHTGCVSYDGTGYYTVDVQGTLHYYNITTNTWTFITSNIRDQSGNSVTNIIKTQNAGDLSIDGIGNLWLLTSSSSNYGLYKFPVNLPTTPVAQLNVIRVINPTAVTPSGNSFAGIAFRPNGQVLMTTKNDNRLYRLNTSTSISFVGNLTTSDVGNDLTSCVFPAGILPVSWISFTATAKNSNMVTLNWEAIEYQNKGYYIECSSNGTDWDEVAFVGAKNSYEAVDAYNFTHVNNFNGRQYYRIRQVDVNGNTNYSEIMTVNLKNEKSGLAVWPNPATDQVRLASNNSDRYTKAQVFDLSGRMYMEIPLQRDKYTINVSKLPIGTYLVKVQTENGITHSQKIVKQ